MSEMGGEHDSLSGDTATGVAGTGFMLSQSASG
jgi:hypothetical protein